VLSLEGTFFSLVAPFFFGTAVFHCLLGSLSAFDFLFFDFGGRNPLGGMGGFPFLFDFAGKF